MSDNRAVRYTEPITKPSAKHPDVTTKVIYRASGVGGCERHLVATARGIPARPHPDWFQDVLDEGTAMEPVIREAALEKLGGRDDTWMDQYELELEVGVIAGQLVVVRAHTDDLHLSSDHNHAVLREYKKFRDSTWGEFLKRKVEVHANYPWQVAAMMWALADMDYEVVCEFIGGHLVDGEIVEVEHQTLIDPPLPRSAFIRKIARVERLIAEGWDPTEVECVAKFPCGHWFLHDDKLGGGDEVVEVELDSGEQQNAVRHWQWCSDQVKHYKAKVAEFESEKRKAAEKLNGWVSAGEVGVAEVDGVEVKVKRYVQEVEESVVKRKGHTRDYYKIIGSKQEREDS